MDGDLLRSVGRAPLICRERNGDTCFPLSTLLEVDIWLWRSTTHNNDAVMQLIANKKPLSIFHILFLCPFTHVTYILWLVHDN